MQCFTSSVSRLVMSLIGLLLLMGCSSATVQIEPSRRTTLPVSYDHLPLSFEANEGQTDPRVSFQAHGSGYSLFLTADEAVLALKKPGGRVNRGHSSSAFQPVGNSEAPASNPEFETPAALRMRLVGAETTAKVTGLEELPGKSNYFIGNDPKKWRTNVPNYAKVKYTNIYPGVDLVYYGNQGQLEYDFVVQPGADPNRIVLDLGTVRKPRAVDHDLLPRVGSNGELTVRADGGELIFHRPLVYQPTRDHEQRTKDIVEAKYVLEGHRVTFEVARYDKTRPLVIDPTLAYSTYVGGSGEDEGFSIAVDTAGNAYITGGAGSPDFPLTPGAFQSTLEFNDAFVSKLNAAGTNLVYSTYLGPSGGGAGIAVDAAGNAYVTGSAPLGVSNFPTTPGAFQTTCGSCAFITKVNPTGSALVYSTYLGGSRGAGGVAIAVDAAGNAYVTGTTFSEDFPTTVGAFQTTPGPFSSNPQDAFVTKLNATGTALVYSTYLGAFATNGIGIAVDASGNAYVVGFSNYADFPTTPGAFSKSGGGFITKLNAAGSSLVYSARLIGTVCNAIAVDSAGNAYVTGRTTAPDFPTTPGAFQTSCASCNLGFNPGDAFITKVNPTGSALVYSTFLGGSSDEGGTGIAVDAAGNAYVTGTVSSTGFKTTPDAFQPFSGGSEDAFVSKLNASGSALLYSTYLGGSDIEAGRGIAVDAAGNAYVTGYSFSSNFPTTPGAFQTALGGVDVFVAKIAAITFAGTPGRPNCQGQSVSALARQYGGLPAAASALGFDSVQALQDAIKRFCEG